MSKKLDTFQSKISRNDRFAQMSHQEKIIEQKKREILAKLEAKQKGHKETEDSTKSVKEDSSPSDVKSTGINLFSNDGSFLDTFKQQVKDRRFESKLKSFKARDNYDKHSDGMKNKWSHHTRTPSPKERSKFTRFEKPSLFEQKITINTSFSTAVPHHYPETFQQHHIPVNLQNVTGQPLLKNIVSQQQELTIQDVLQPTTSVIAAPPLLLNVPPPQIIQNQLSAPVVVPRQSSSLLATVSLADVIPTVQPATVLTSQEASILATQQLAPVQATNISLPQSVVLTTVSLPSTTIITSHSTPISTPAGLPGTTTCIQTMELASIPPPNPIQVQNIPQPEPLNTLNIPQPEPLNTLNIPPPAPMQVQNIPTPTTLQLNEIPNPKPLDILAIPTPNEENLSDHDFIKNIPPPNKAVPPPSLTENTIQSTSTCLPLTNILTTPQSISAAPFHQTVTVQNITPTQNVILHNLNQTQVPPVSQPNQALQNIATAVPPPNLQASNAYTTVTSISVAMPVGIVEPSPSAVSNNIPSLMAQPVLPPTCIGLNPSHINLNCPPPLLSINNPDSNTLNNGELSELSCQMPPMNVPPPPPPTLSTMQPNIAAIHQQTNMNVGDMPAPNMKTGTPDYEAMASLGRMVAQCGTGIEDIVRQRKPQDPSLWFLFYKESAAYQQYQQLIEQFRAEAAVMDQYEPESFSGDEASNQNQADQRRKSTDRNYNTDRNNRRKRRSRWGDKQQLSLSPTSSYGTSPTSSVPSVQLPQRSGTLMLSKITRTDPGLIQYALNTYRSSNLTEEEWKKAEDHYKINLLYQDMVRKREELERLQMDGKNKYEYDSEEETEGGTWEHKLREKEMIATQLWAQELTRQAEGKHHIGDFLPPEELKRFMEKSSAVKEGRMPNFSDYKEFKIKEDNIGFKMLQKLGWSEGEGLGCNGEGITEPINKALARESNQGLGAGDTNDNDDEYESYRKRMMLAYRFRPNPLNNPRRPYY